MAHATEHHVDAAETTADQSEANVMLAFCAAMVVALFGFVLAQPKGGHAPDAHHAEGGVAATWHSHPGEAAVATAAPEASAAAIEVLEKGGNAFDALVAASFVVSVVRPQSTGIGGGGFVVYHDAAAGRQGALDGREAAPSAARPEMAIDPATGDEREGYTVGPLSAGVPGLVAMLEEIFQQKGSGKVTWAELVAPAVALAEEGFEVPGPLSHSIAQHRADLERYPASRAVFLPGGRVPQPGELLRQPGLANTLRAIARDGAPGFYKGPIAAELSRAARDHGGLISERDLETYRPAEREVVRGTYRGRTVVSMPPPSSGGAVLIEMLNVLSGYDLEALGHNSPQHLHLLAETMRRAFADRSKFFGDPDFIDVPVGALTDPAYAARLRASIDPEHASRSTLDDPGRLLHERDHTTHISIVDAAGNAVASTQTVNTGLGSCFVAGDTGVVLNNEMADFTSDPEKPNPFGLRQGPQNLPAPRKRPMSSMSPTLVLDGEGQVVAVLGSPGGPKIITTVLQILSNLVDFDLPPAEAVEAPRMHHQWLPDRLRLESGLKGQAAALAARGHEVEVLDEGVILGNAQIVVREGGGWVGVSDPRGTGRPATR